VKSAPTFHSPFEAEFERWRQLDQIAAGPAVPGAEINIGSFSN
jgi:hypothetical protein